MRARAAMACLGLDVVLMPVRLPDAEALAGVVVDAVPGAIGLSPVRLVALGIEAERARLGFVVGDGGGATIAPLDYVGPGDPRWEEVPV